jgi:hypothetical protein
VKLSAAQQRTFFAEFNKAAAQLKLDEWRFYFETADIDDAYAQAAIDRRGHTAVIRLARDWGDRRPVRRELRHTARHEALHVLFSAIRPDKQDRENCAREEGLCRKMERIVWERDYAIK